MPTQETLAFDPGRMWPGFRMTVGLLLAPIDAVFVSVRSIIRRFNNPIAQNKALRGIPLGSRSGALTGLAIGFTVALLIPIPGSAAAYLTSVGGVYLLASTVGYLSAILGRCIGTGIGCMIDRYRNRDVLTELKKNETTKYAFGIKHIIYTGLFGDKATEVLFSQNKEAAFPESSTLNTLTSRTRSSQANVVERIVTPATQTQTKVSNSSHNSP